MTDTKLATKPSWMTDKKERFKGVAWCLSKLETPFGLLETEVIKNWQNDTTKQYARFMVRAWSPATSGSKFPDFGDEYCALVYEGELVEVLGEPATTEQMNEWASLRQRATKPIPRL